MSGRPKGRPSTEAEDKLFEKYKYVRFVERQKVERKLKGCRRELAECIQGKSEANPEEIQQRINGHLGDLQYIKFYPHGEKYISLFPKDGKLKPRESAKQKSIRESIRNRLESKKEIEERILEKQETKETVEKRETVDDFFADDDNVSPRHDDYRSSKGKGKGEGKGKGKGKGKGRDVAPDKGHGKGWSHGAKRSRQTEEHMESFKARKTAEDSKTFDEEGGAPVQVNSKNEPISALKQLEAPSNHPSWAAKAAPSQRGTLTKFEGARTTFDDSDSD